MRPSSSSSQPRPLASQSERMKATSSPVRRVLTETAIAPRSAGMRNTRRQTPAHWESPSRRGPVGRLPHASSTSPPGAKAFRSRRYVNATSSKTIASWSGNSRDRRDEAFANVHEHLVVSAVDVSRSRGVDQFERINDRCHGVARSNLRRRCSPRVAASYSSSD